MLREEKEIFKQDLKAEVRSVKNECVRFRNGRTNVFDFFVQNRNSWWEQWQVAVFSLASRVKEIDTLQVQLQLQMEKEKVWPQWRSTREKKI